MDGRISQSLSLKRSEAAPVTGSDGMGIGWDRLGGRYRVRFSHFATGDGGRRGTGRTVLRRKIVTHRVDRVAGGPRSLSDVDLGAQRLSQDRCRAGEDRERCVPANSLRFPRRDPDRLVRSPEAAENESAEPQDELSEDRRHPAPREAGKSTAPLAGKHDLLHNLYIQQKPFGKVGRTLPRSVLLVDDEAGIRLTMSAIFEANGFEVETASSAQEAIGAIGAEAFDVILTDLRMETPTAGFDVADFAAKHTPQPIVMVVSAYPKLGAGWRQRGVHAFFEKPTEISKLLRSIEELLPKRNGAAAALERVTKGKAQPASASR